MKASDWVVVETLGGVRLILNKTMIIAISVPERRVYTAESNKESYWALSEKGMKMLLDNLGVG